MKVLHYRDGTLVFLAERGDTMSLAIELDGQTLRQLADGDVEITVSALYEPGRPPETRVEVVQQPETASEQDSKRNPHRPRLVRLRGPIRVNGISVTPACHQPRRVRNSAPRPRAHRARRPRRHTSRRRATSRDDGGSEPGDGDGGGDREGRSS